MEIRINPSSRYTWTKQERVEGDVTFVNLHFDFAEKRSPDEITIYILASDKHYYSIYTPEFLSPHNLLPDWGGFKLNSNISHNMPTYALLGNDGDCLCTFSLSDVRLPCVLSCGYLEEDDLTRVRIKLFSGVCPPMDSYDVTLRIDRKKCNMFDAGQRVVEWWKSLGYDNEYITEEAFEPVYSTWYAFHQKLSTKELYDECCKAAELGMKTLIIDDGWQTDDNNRGYAYTGEWQVTKNKFEDFAKFVADVHKLGIKVAVWYAVPFVGYKTEIHKRFEGKYLYNDDNFQTSMLDPRYKEVRDYLVGVYTDAMKKYDIDGFKLDFIECFSFTSAFTYNEEMDIYTLEDAIQTLLDEIRAGVLAIKKDALIEFRQAYYGPVIGKYANMMRVADCPGDILTNLNESVRMRSFSSGAAVHSDMLTCNENEPLDLFLSQFLAVFFAVPQFSFMLGKLSEEKTRVLKHYIDFQIVHRETLLKSRLRTYSPGKRVTRVDALGADEIITVLYADGVVKLGESRKHYAINSTGKSGLYVKGGEKDYKYRLYDLFGNVTEEGTVSNGSICELDLGNSAIAEFSAI